MSAGDAFERDLLAAMPKLHRHANRLVRNSDAAADLVQDTLMLALQNRETFCYGDSAALAGWLYTIMRNRWISTCRTQQRRGTVVPIDEIALPACAGSQDAMLDLRDAIRGIAALPRHHRMAVLSMGVGGADYAEYAAAHRMAEGTAKSQLARARRALHRSQQQEAIPA